VLGLLQNALSSQGLATEKFRKKFRGIDSEWLPLFRRRTCSFRGIPRFTEESIWKLGTEENGMKKISVTKNFAPANRKDSMFFQDMLQNKIPRVCFYFFLWNGIPSIFLLCRTIWNGIPRVFYSPDGSEWNSESLLLFFFNGTEFRAFFSSAEWFTTEFREFSVLQNSRNSAVLSSAE
jgi:hypothetical protein